jgi:hypothetical protein
MSIVIATYTGLGRLTALQSCVLAVSMATCRGMRPTAACGHTFWIYTHTHRAEQTCASMLAENTNT